MRISIEKYDPSTDAAPRFVDYTVPAEEHMTMLQALQYIDENVEPVAFDYSCRGRACGRCAMMINGKPALACVAPVGAEDSYTVEPLSGHPVIRDLVVDKSALHGRLGKAYKRIRYPQLTQADVLAPVDPIQGEHVHFLEFCARCGVCNAGCPVVNDGAGGNSRYVGPAQMMATAFRFYDPYDQADRVLEAVQNGLWDCIMCGNCDKVCNALEINHVAIYEDLRAAATARGLTA